MYCSKFSSLCRMDRHHKYLFVFIKFSSSSEPRFMKSDQTSNARSRQPIAHLFDVGVRWHKNADGVSRERLQLHLDLFQCNINLRIQVGCAMELPTRSKLLFIVITRLYQGLHTVQWWKY